MAAVAFLGCFCTGHQCWPPRTGVTASPNVRVGGIPVHRVGDAWFIHCCPKLGCHPGVVVTGASNVHVNGRPVARIGDVINCGSMIAMGYPTVNAGGVSAGAALGIASKLGL